MTWGEGLGVAAVAAGNTQGVGGLHGEVGKGLTRGVGWRHTQGVGGLGDAWPAVWTWGNSATPAPLQ